VDNYGYILYNYCVSFFRRNILWLLPVLSGFLLSLSLDYAFLSWLALLGLLPLLFFLQYGSKSKKMVFFGGWLAGFVFFALHLRWFITALPGEWAGARESAVNILGFFIVWLGSAVILGFSFGIFSLAARFFKKRVLLIVPSCWVLSEYFRAWLFSFWSIGPESLLGPYWTFGHLGYALAHTPAVFLSRYTGLYGLSFVVVIVNVLIWKRCAAGLCLFFSLLIVFFLVTSVLFVSFSSGTEIRADLLQTKGQEFYYLGLRNFFENDSLPISGEQFLRLVVFPEGSNFFSLIDDDAESVLSDIFHGDNGLIVSSAVMQEGGSRYEMIIYRDEKGELLGTQKKNFLIPAGEYMPYLLGWPIRLFGYGDYLGTFNELRYFSRGHEREKPVSFNGIKVGTLLCSGVVAPDFYRQLADEGAEILINSASHLVFSSSAQALYQAETYDIFQAAANARYFLQSAAGDKALIISPDGRIAATGERFANGFVSGTVYAIGKKTFYTKHGEWVIFLSAFFLGFNWFFAGFVIYLKRKPVKDVYAKIFKK